MTTPPLESFQIGWICALAIEAAAAKEMLDEDFGILDTQDPADANSYRLGQIRRHNVVIACLPAGKYGTTSATAVAKDMARTFSTSLRIGLMVGIGGGIPSTTHDIRLGDVVISQPEGTFGGVVQYDMGKVETGGEFRRTGSLNSPPQSLLTAVAQVRATELTDDPRYPDYMTCAIARNKRTQKSFSKPIGHDHLYKSEYDHLGSKDNCEDCLAEWKETRCQREESNPEVHYGVIASGNCVIKHGRTREQLRQETGALCFEMEAAGLMIDFPCLVIRGICDYADSHKNKQWQGYAALAAASYAKELLSYVPKGRVSQETLAVDLCNGLKEEVQGTNLRLDKIFDLQESVLWDDEQHKCHQMFKRSNYEDQKSINPIRAPETCQWVLQSPRYLDWRNSSSSDLLWITADPGCGKSVLARSLIDSDLPQELVETSVLYFFFKSNEEQESLDVALCAVLHQLFSQHPGLIHHALPLWKQNGDKLQYETHELWRIFMAAVSDPVACNTICIFDALDECHVRDQKRLLDNLETFCKQRSSIQKPSLKFLVTSRPYDDIAIKFRTITDSSPEVHIQGENENDQIRHEIDSVIESEMEEFARTLDLPLATQKWLQEQLFRMEHRTYLWLHLAIDDMRTTFRNSLRPEKEAKECIRLTPPSVSAAYAKILDSVPREQSPTVMKIFKIIVGARRPLTVEEMAMALGIALSPECVSAKDARLEPIGLAEKLRRLCGLFVFVHKSKIYLLHETAKEYLVTNDLTGNMSSMCSFSLPDAHTQLSEICIRYILMDDLQHDGSLSSIDVHVLLDYSAKHWADHVRNASLKPQGNLEALLDQIYDTSLTSFSTWFSIFWKSVMRNHRKPTLSAIHLAAFNGHKQVLQRLISSDKQNLDQTDETGCTGLIWASRNGHLETVHLLLENGSNVDIQGGFLGNALYTASSKGHKNVVRALLNHGANVNAQCKGYSNVKKTAPTESHDEILRTLCHNKVRKGALHGSSIGNHDILQLPIGFTDLASAGDRGNLPRGFANLDSPPSNFNNNALYAASSKGHQDIVKLLLDKGADVNAKGGLCGTALHAACLEGHSEAVSILLRSGAEVNQLAGLYGSPLYVAAVKGHVQILHQLIAHGADVNGVGEQYGNALLAGAAEGHEEVMHILLEHGAKFYSKGDVDEFLASFGYSLFAAASQGYCHTLRILLSFGSVVDAIGEDYSVSYVVFQKPYGDIGRLLEERFFNRSRAVLYSAALLVAVLRGHEETIQILLEGGADSNALCDKFGHALFNASSEGNDALVRLLLEIGNDSNSEREYHRYAFQAACYGGREGTAQLLLDREFDFDRIEYLECACEKGYSRIVLTLLEREADAYGADAYIEGDSFGHFLCAACLGGHTHTVKILLDRGANVNSRNALESACEKGHTQIVHMLLERGADVNIQSDNFDNALNAACIAGHNQVVHVLLDRGADINSKKALESACAMGHNQIVNTLLERGADVNTEGDTYGGALLTACRWGCDEIVLMLLERGADVDIQSVPYGSALQAARERKFGNIVQMLQRRKAGEELPPQLSRNRLKIDN